MYVTAYNSSKDAYYDRSSNVTNALSTSTSVTPTTGNNLSLITTLWAV